ncbi:hypothetical protein A2973_01655 [Candidatus Gottesmanbacteria bacterium RIFCSPLOWO2_01_FULL_49_10]|uniref:Uncharacterized protein n=1 Tax=Candidatus Gottesmanbacteria bacterium RIFCSPLOWO2_01_FULL_49_10 TaxID=1798396 RepID=A0A1F6AWV5_9BACT|nr:MAG: hypothetical protein A2973_01655 [Candidatus Gottesmanbacteria bacterium RIFCSPLOWO2_01_FULL_49_10]
MKIGQRSVWWLIGFVSGISALAWLVNNYSPDSLKIHVLFFSIIFCTSFCLLLYLINNVRRCLLISSGFVVFLVLRSLQLRELLYPLLLVATLLSLELMLRKR